MKGFGLVQGAAAALAAFGLMLPPSQVSAQDGRPAATSQAKLAADVVLLEGAFAGRVVDHTGSPLADRQVVVKQGNKEVARVATNKDGIFAVKDLKPGMYVAGSGNTEGQFRVWSEKTAPAAAKGHALIVMGQNGARGQIGAVDPTLLLLTVGIIATVIISAITLSEVDKIPKSN